MYRGLFLVFFGLFFAACGVQKNVVEYKPVEVNKNADLNFRVMKALNDEYFMKYTQARDEYLRLFEESKQSAFLEKAFLLTLLNNLDNKEEISVLAKEYMNQNIALKKLVVLYNLQINDLEQAQNLLKEVLQIQKDAKNYELLGDILMQQQKITEAFGFYEMAYKINISEELVLKMTRASILSKQTNQARMWLEDFRNKKGCTLKTCILLVKIYNDAKEYNGLEKIYLDLYEISKNQTFLYAILELFDTQKQYQKALDLALKFDLKPDMIVYFYQNLKQYDNAFKLCLKLYQKTQNKSYLLQAAVMEFEDAMEKKQVNKNVLESVSKKFEQALDENTEALYLNYYGYMLIDYNLDVNKGIELVIKALNAEPDNLYYLDSLSWGYYKQNKCSKAWDVMTKTLHDKEFSASNESKRHIRAIQKCLKSKK
ncbi:ATP-dependent nuclease subunit B [Campylobacter sp. CCS1377]|uniref:ATP-dependent nuclease subunit B n=1 Tax=Campylobacter sp. CCS1377 TaxID=3158229 RepID=A0AAU7E7A2_9BACT|nr:ATP-dependent nuclease subunit B [Campylobacter jejuni]